MRKLILIIFFFFSIVFFVRAICCDQGCYPDANCCGGSDGIGYVGCNSTGGVIYCPQNDAIDGTPLLGGDACLNCLCSDTSTCWWDASGLCPVGEICLRVDDGEGLPETSLCVNEGCNICEDCDGNCVLEYCHSCGTGQCYYDPQLIGDDCYSCDDPRTDECSDYNDDPNACNGEIGVCNQLSCYWIGTGCNECEPTTQCEDYTDISTCELYPCPSTVVCLWENGQCVTIQPSVCDNDGKADKEEACDGGDLRGKKCIDFGFDGGSLSCSNCEYNFTYCEGYDLGDCGDGTLDVSKEACDCGGGSCSLEQLNYKSCSDFGQFNSGILRCYDDCSFDTRDCKVCDGDGTRELGEACDCVGISCSLDQLNYKSCSDFGFIGGDLGCDEDCEYDFTYCEGHDLGECGDGTLDVGKEACDCGGSECSPEQLNNKGCSDFDYFSSGALQCYDTCEFDTRECEIIDPDDDYVACELKYEGNQGNCGEIGDYWCWDPNAEGGSGECCGDDKSSNDKWINTENMSCCQDSVGNYVFQTDADFSSCFCNLMGETFEGANTGVCDTTGKIFCWSSVIGGCCGDDKNEVWNYSTSYGLDDILVEETCYNGVWITAPDLIYYDLSADLV